MQNTTKAPQRPALGRGAPGVAAKRVVDKEDDDHHDEYDGQGGGQRFKALPPGKTGYRRANRFEHHRNADDQDRVDDRRKRPRDEPGQQQLADVLFDDDRIDHQNSRGRDQ